MKIDCGRCEIRGQGCQDCVITVLVPRNGSGFPADMPGYLGEETLALYRESKRLELQRFRKIVSAAEYEWYI